MKTATLPPTTTVPLTEIDGLDRTYSIRPPWSQNAALAESVARIGVLSPVHLERIPPGYRVVSGFNRVQAASKAGLAQVPAIVWRDTDPLLLFQVQLEENLSGPELAEIEKALAIGALREQFGLTDEEILTDYLGRLGVRPDRYQLQLLLRIARLPEDLQRALTTLSSESCLRIAPWGISERQCVVDLVRRFRFGRSKEREVVALLADFRAGSRTTPPLYPAIEQFVAPYLTAVPADNQAGEEFLNRLREMRFPALEAHRNRFGSLRKRLGLADIQLTPPRNFEGDRYTVQFTLRDIADLDRSVGQLKNALGHSEIQALFDLL